MAQGPGEQGTAAELRRSAGSGGSPGPAWCWGRGRGRCRPQGSGGEPAREAQQRERRRKSEPEGLSRGRRRGGTARPGPPSAAVASREPLPAPPVSPPMVLPGSCCPLQGLVPLPQAAGGSLSAAAARLSPPSLRPGAPSRRRPCPSLPFRPLLGLGLLQTGLGCALVALSFGALSLSSAPQVKNACPVWAGSSVSVGRGPGLAMMGSGRASAAPAELAALREAWSRSSAIAWKQPPRNG